MAPAIPSASRSARSRSQARTGLRNLGRILVAGRLLSPCELRCGSRGMSMQSDSEIVRAVLAGDREAFASLVAVTSGRPGRQPGGSFAMITLRRTPRKRRSSRHISSSTICAIPARFGVWLLRIAAGRSRGYSSRAVRIRSRRRWRTAWRQRTLLTSCSVAWMKRANRIGGRSGVAVVKDTAGG